MHVGIALAVRMAHHVHRNAIDENREVGAVVRVETAKQNLIGFAAAVMLADDQTRSQLQNIARSVGRTKLQIFFPASLFSCRRRRLLPPDVDLNWFCGGLCLLCERLRSDPQHSKPIQGAEKS